MLTVKRLPSLAEDLDRLGQRLPAAVERVVVEEVWLAHQRRISSPHPAEELVEEAKVCAVCLRCAVAELRVRQLEEKVAVQQAIIDAQKAILDLREERAGR